MPGPRGGQRETAGQGGGPRAAPSADDTDGQRRPFRPLGRVGEAVDEEALGSREAQHALRADLDGQPPQPRIVPVPADEEGSRPAHRSPAPGRGVVPDQDERRVRPARPPLGHPMVHLGLHAGGGAQPQEVVEQPEVLGDDQRPGPTHPLRPRPLRPRRPRTRPSEPRPARPRASEPRPARPRASWSRRARPRVSGTGRAHVRRADSSRLRAPRVPSPRRRTACRTPGPGSPGCLHDALPSRDSCRPRTSRQESPWGRLGNRADLAEKLWIREGL